MSVGRGENVKWHFVSRCLEVVVTLSSEAMPNSMIKWESELKGTNVAGAVENNILQKAWSYIYLEWRQKDKPHNLPVCRRSKKVTKKHTGNTRELANNNIL